MIPAYLDPGEESSLLSPLVIGITVFVVLTAVIVWLVETRPRPAEPSRPAGMSGTKMFVVIVAAIVVGAMVVRGLVAASA